MDNNTFATTSGPVLSAYTGKPMISPQELSKLLGQEHQPTTDQAAVIGFPAASLQVLAGAGAGKTETMAARVVWLVAAGIATPGQVLGLTFTRKAAQELGQRIRLRLEALARSSAAMAVLDNENGDLARELKVINPLVKTYDAFAGEFVNEFGLLRPFEPSNRVGTNTEVTRVAREVVYQDPEAKDLGSAPKTVVDNVVRLSHELNANLADPDEVRQFDTDFLDHYWSLPKKLSAKEGSADAKSLLDGGRILKEDLGYKSTVAKRSQLLGLVEKFEQRMAELSLTTFNQKMRAATEVAKQHPEVGAAMRHRFRVVMLDEYQDTSFAQREFLRSLFGGTAGADAGMAVTSVGDPMQAIYGWRGASSINLQAFPEDFPAVAGSGYQPGATRELTTSWRNPTLVLDIANKVSELTWDRFYDGQAGVSALSARPDSIAGDVTIDISGSQDEELVKLADDIARVYHAEADPTRFEGAVLVRKNRYGPILGKLLSERDVPFELASLGGLLYTPEVQDVVAMLTMLVDPGNNSAALRMLCGAHVNLSVHDLRAVFNAAQERSKAMLFTVAEDASTDNSGPADTSSEDKSTEAKSTKHQVNAIVARQRMPELFAALDEAAAAAPEEQQPAWAELKRQLEEQSISGHGMYISLTEVIGDPARIEGLSNRGLNRLENFAKELKFLRTRSLAGSMGDCVVAIINVLGLNTEVLARKDPLAPGASGMSHLDRLMAEVEKFSRTPGANLRELLEYFDTAKDADSGLEPGDVAAEPGRVQIMSVHKSKGLEWDHVWVPLVTQGNYSTEKVTEYFLTNAVGLAQQFRGDADHDDTGRGAPLLHLDTLEQRSELKPLITEHKERLKDQERAEGYRLLYVALTRAKKSLRISAHYGDEKSFEAVQEALAVGFEEADLSKYPSAAPAIPLVAVTQDFPSLTHMVTDVSAVINLDALVERVDFPRDFLGARHDSVEAAAKAVASKMNALEAGEVAAPEFPEASLPWHWDVEVGALIDEATAAAERNRVIELPMKIDLGATEVASLNADPVQYARRMLRPVPFEPNPFARRGTAFHEWLEEKFNINALFDSPADSVHHGDRPVERELERLKESWENSVWADRVPVRAEASFDMALGNHIIRGQIDAVYRLPDENDPDKQVWWVVDWKTGSMPQGKDLENKKIQLSVYRLAWAEIISQETGQRVDPADIRACFFYVSKNKSLEPENLHTKEEILALIEAGLKV